MLHLPRLANRMKLQKATLIVWAIYKNTLLLLLLLLLLIDINVKHVHRRYPFSHLELSGTVRCILELLCISNNENELPGFTKSDVDTMINALCTC